MRAKTLNKLTFGYVFIFGLHINNVGNIYMYNWI